MHPPFSAYPPHSPATACLEVRGLAAAAQELDEALGGEHALVHEQDAPPAELAPARDENVHLRPGNGSTAAFEEGNI